MILKKQLAITFGLLKKKCPGGGGALVEKVRFFQEAEDRRFKQEATIAQLRKELTEVKVILFNFEKA